MGVCKISFQMRLRGVGQNEGPEPYDYTMSSITKYLAQAGRLSNTSAIITLSGILTPRSIYVRHTSATVSGNILRVATSSTGVCI